MKPTIFAAVAAVSLTVSGHGQTFLMLNFDEAVDGTYTTGTVYTAGASEVVNTAGVGIGPATFKFVDSEGPDASDEIAADGASIGAAPAAVTGIRQGGKVLLTDSGGRDEGLRVFVNNPLTNQSFTMEAIWFTNDSTETSNAGAIQTIIGDNWPQLHHKETSDPLRSQFVMDIAGANQFRYSADQSASVVLGGSPVTVSDTWYHDAYVFTYNDTDPANSKVTGYRNGRKVGEKVYNAATGETVGLFGMADSRYGQHTLTIGMSNSFEYRINDHRRGLNGGIDAIAITRGVLSPSQFVLPYDTTPATPLTIQNPSFEADAEPAFPGYAGAITGWQKVGTNNFGLNSKPGPFMDNGAVPDGTKVLLLQNPVGVRQSVPGFVPGQNYTFRAFVNSRESTPEAVVRVTVGSTVIVQPTTVPKAGGDNPFLQISQAFDAPGSGALNVTIENTNASGDNTLLVDMVTIEPTVVVTSASDWSLYQ